MSSAHQVQRRSAMYNGSYTEGQNSSTYDVFPDALVYELLPDLELWVARERYRNDEISHEEYFATMDRCLRELASRGEDSSPRIVPIPTPCVDLDWAEQLVEESRPCLMAKL